MYTETDPRELAIKTARISFNGATLTVEKLSEEQVAALAFRRVAAQWDEDVAGEVYRYRWMHRSDRSQIAEYCERYEAKHGHPFHAFAQ